LLLGRALVPPWLLLIPAVITIAAWLVVTPAVTAIPLMIGPAAATSVASTTPAAIPAAALMAVAMLVARPLRTLRPRRTHRGFIRCERLFRLLFGFQPAEQPAEEAGTCRFRRLTRGSGR